MERGDRGEIGSEEYGMDDVDVYKEESYGFVDRLLEEYVCGE